MKELWSLARDASVAVGAYVGMVRDRFWETLSNGDSFDETLARAKAEFAADRLADKEEAEEVAEPDDLWEPDELWRLPLDHPTRLEMEMLLADALSRNNTSAPGGFPSPGSDSSSRQSAQGAVEEPPEVEPTPPVKAPSGGLNPKCPYCHHRLSRIDGDCLEDEMESRACNCTYGLGDERCCVNRALHARSYGLKFRKQ